MKKCKMISGLVLMGMCVLGVSVAQGGTIGRSYVDGGYQLVRLGSYDGGDNVLDQGWMGVRLGGLENMDAVFSFAGGTLDGYTIRSLTAGFQPYFKPEEGIYKVFADVRVIYTDVTNDGSDYSESGVGVMGGIGSELDLIPDTLSILGEFAYISESANIKSEDDFKIMGSINYWATKWLMLEAGMGYGTTTEDFTLTLGLGVGF